MEPQIVLKIDNNQTLKASNFKIFLGACPQTPLQPCDYRTSVLISASNNFTLIPLGNMWKITDKVPVQRFATEYGNSSNPLI